MPKNAPILVTGVPGNVGSVGGSVVKLLRERDLPVRALVLRLDERAQALREETGAEIVVVDLTNGADVVRALRGCNFLLKVFLHLLKLIYANDVWSFLV